MLQRRSCTRTTRRKPCITIRMRTPIPGLLKQTMALWSSTSRYAPRGASSLWFDIFLWSFSSPPYIQDANKNTRCTGGVCLCGVGMLVLLGMLSYPVWLHSIPILPLPLPLFFFFFTVCEAVQAQDFGGQGGRHSARPTGSTAGLNASVLDSSTGLVILKICLKCCL